MRKLKILVDMDEIAVNLIDEWLRIYNREWHDDLTREQVRGWDVHSYTRPDCGIQIYQILQRPGLYDYLPPNPGAIETVSEWVQRGHDVRFATAAPSADSCRGKVEWVKRNFKHLDFGISRVLFLHDKRWLAPSVDVLIDDKPQTIQEWREYADEAQNTQEHIPKIFTIAHPHNIRGREHADGVAFDYKDMESAWMTLDGFIRELE